MWCVQGLLNPAAMARMALGEALTNLTWARATSLADVKASVNWMYAAKLGSEGANMYDAAVALKCVPATLHYSQQPLPSCPHTSARLFAHLILLVQ